MAELCSAFEDTLQDNIKLEKHRFELLAIYRHDGDLNPHKTNNFSGPPRPELEEAWDRLMKNADIKVSHAELGEFAGDDSVIKLSDGSGYYVTVSAFHGLHCVKRLHMYIYAEHYYAGLSEFELFMLRRHTGMLRHHENVLCWNMIILLSFQYTGLLMMPAQWHRMTATISVLTGVKLKSGWQSALSIHLSRVFSYTPFSPVMNLSDDSSVTESDRTPFLSREECAVSSTGDKSDLFAKARKRHYQCSLSQAITYLLAVWGFISVCYNTYRLISTSLSPHTPSPDAAKTQEVDSNPHDHHPEALPHGLNVCDCGTTIEEALSLNCIYDSLSAAWLPPYCRDDELTAQFERAGPGPNGTWSFFYDENGTMPISKAEIAALGETGGSFWASEEWHAAHCLFYWQKYYRMKDTGVILEARFDSLHHVKHCTQLIMDPGPGYFVLIEVPVVMNSSANAVRTTKVSGPIPGQARF
ncbi:hypothetical protein CBS147343_2015 [Aspergillus niger]|nr:hypothetical protein CBS12448_3985 [Aspergillus niger]KAI2915536.1 hypothetical protein CBS147371_5821 [Aspergillus niger]KAI2957395.1 hypothetical protein CBS147324_10728 [Aspergillus niger]KAI2961428.1 hypothetical protein CBS147322_66 [Aspergillus niger]KAI2982040.1 hypothetical protein CBS147344_9020 [Aspergillus niger]